jgi:predicted phage-related endonuclease
MAVETIAIADRDDWLQLRKEAVNASEVAIVLGLGHWGSRAELYAEKKNLRPPRVDNNLLRRGRWLEASVFEALADERPEWEIRRAKIYLLDRERHLGATPDGFALRTAAPAMGRRRGVVQAKVISRTAFRRRWLHNADDDLAYGNADVPVYYQLQVLTEMMLSDCEWGTLAALITSEYDATLRTFDIERDGGLEQMIVNAVAAFYRDHLDPGVMPDFAPQQDGELIRALYPRADGSTIDLSGNNRIGELIEAWQEQGAALARINKQQKTSRAAIEALMRDATYGTLADGRCLQWRNEPRRAYSVGPSNPRVLRLLKSAPQSAPIDDDEDGDDA